MYSTVSNVLYCAEYRPVDILHATPCGQYRPVPAAPHRTTVHAVQDIHPSYVCIVCTYTIRRTSAHKVND